MGSRIAEVVKKVFVKNNDFVEQGTLLVTLDRAMLEVQADQKRGNSGQEELRLEQLTKTLETNRASLDLARDKVAIGIASLIESSKNIEEKQLQVRYRVASLRVAAASLRSAQVDLVLAQKEFNRVDHLVAKQSATQAELDQKRSVLDSTRERVKAAEQQVQQVRGQLALSPSYQQPDQIPNELERTDTEVRKSVATGQQILAQLGIQFGRNLDPMVFHQVVTVTLARPQGWIDQISSVREAQGQLDQTLAALGGKSFDPSRLYRASQYHETAKGAPASRAQAELYRNSRPVTGVVNRKSVNPGDHVQASQALMSIQPLDSVYIVANFKENQLSDIVIGQPVEICVDAYPERPLKGRVTGFAAATGAASSLLPAENATGNFVKVVQRLPVRIDLAEPNPRKTPLLVGMSVIPLVDIKAMPTGPDAGKGCAARRLFERRRASRKLRPPGRSRDECEHGRSHRPGRVHASIQSLADRAHRDDGHLHGGTGHLDRQRRLAAHRGEPLGLDRGEHVVLTSYLVSNAIILPLSGWLSSVLGRKRYYMISVFLFTVASALCGFATSIEQLVFFRVLQGLGGGGLQPSEQAILMDTFPPSRRGMAMAVYGVSILVAPVLGPTLGGFITDNYTWRWIFYINVPVGLLSLILSGIVVEDPPYLKKMRAKRASHKHRVDSSG